MRKDPVRLEEWLTRDYVDRASKLSEFMVRQPDDPTISTEDLIATVVVVLVLIITWMVMSW